MEEQQDVHEAQQQCNAPQQLESSAIQTQFRQNSQLAQTVKTGLGVLILLYMFAGREVSSTLSNRTTNSTIEVFEKLFDTTAPDQVRTALNYFSLAATAFVYLFGTVDRVQRTRQQLTQGSASWNRLACCAVLVIFNAWSTAFTTYGSTASTIDQGQDLPDHDRAWIGALAAGAGLYTMLYYTLQIEENFRQSHRRIRYGNNAATYTYSIALVISIFSWGVSAYYGASMAETQARFNWSNTAQIVANVFQVIPVVIVNGIAQLPGMEQDIANRFQPQSLTQPLVETRQPLLEPANLSLTIPAPAPRARAIPNGPAVAFLRAVGTFTAYSSNILNSSGNIGTSYSNLTGWGLSGSAALYGALGLGLPITVVNFLLYRTFRTQAAIDGVTRVGNAVSERVGMLCQGGERARSTTSASLSDLGESQAAQAGIELPAAGAAMNAVHWHPDEEVGLAHN
ncbi:MAG: hypothetical protein K0Q57_302 [Gammaproteobacteria bacterium]|jgi:hypothetical protein|nr:hypothetical protein [Gammaproteobacteria bacterium]